MTQEKLNEIRGINMSLDKKETLININDVDCEFVMSDFGDTYPTEDLKSEWNSYTEEERRGWYTTTKEIIEINAEDLLWDKLEQIEWDTYEDFCSLAYSSISEEQFERVQEVLDEICGNGAFDVYWQDVKIDPKSEVL